MGETILCYHQEQSLFLNLDSELSWLPRHKERETGEDCFGEFYGLGLEWHISPLYVSSFSELSLIRVLIKWETEKYTVANCQEMNERFGEYIGVSTIALSCIHQMHSLLLLTIAHSRLSVCIYHCVTDRYAKYACYHLLRTSTWLDIWVINLLITWFKIFIWHLCVLCAQANVIC